MLFRGYDPAIGRMNGVDIMAGLLGSPSPYHYALNDPVFWNDPMGDLPTYQRSDDTWWVAPRGTRGKYGGFDTPGSWSKYASEGASFNFDPWGWTGMTEGMVYGDGANLFGTGYVPGIYSGSGRMNQEGWVPEWLVNYTTYSDGVERVNNVKLLGFVQTRNRQAGSRQSGSGGPPTLEAGLPALAVPLYYAIGEALAAVGLTAVTYHANDKRSMRDNYVYVIKAYQVANKDKRKLGDPYQVIKYGVSSDTGWRVRGQVSAYNRRQDGMHYTYQILHNQVPGRLAALAIEQYYVTMYAVQNNGTIPRDQYRPNPEGY
jgi:hypothetical protein